MNAQAAHEANLDEICECKAWIQFNQYDLFRCPDGGLTGYAVGLVNCSVKALEAVGPEASAKEFNEKLNQLETAYRNLR